MSSTSPTGMVSRPPVRGGFPSDEIAAAALIAARTAKENGGAAAAVPWGDDRFVVRDETRRRSFTVWTAGPEMIGCDCLRASRGAICWHVVAAMMRMQNRPVAA